MSKERNFLYAGDVDTFAFDWGRLALTVAPETNGATRFSGGIVDLGAGQGHARHNHPGAEEIIFVISGNGEQMVEDPDGNPIRRRADAALRRLLAGRTGTGPARPARLPPGAAARQLVGKSFCRRTSGAPDPQGRSRL